MATICTGGLLCVAKVMFFLENEKTLHIIFFNNVYTRVEARKGHDEAMRPR